MQAKDDIIEFALNHGIEAAAKRFDVPKDEVSRIYNKFVDEMYYPCSCAAAQAKGITRMCFMCDHTRVPK